ncbi:MAG TPA: peptidoglycan DD-metalloendopeptidase family protein [Bacillota bacterium]|nr:peptidoglycan DD-metalloendopeptidase family protein [Bacillota bacterium]HUM55922.1 peptidoglycan DD-metalloendopeptidase family protein [Bacillota bacterium]
MLKEKAIKAGSSLVITVKRLLTGAGDRIRIKDLGRVKTLLAPTEIIKNLKNRVLDIRRAGIKGTAVGIKNGLRSFLNETDIFHLTLPQKKKLGVFAAVIFVFSLTVGWASTSQAIDRPFVSAEGEVMETPWVISVEGEDKIVARSRDAAQLIMDGVKQNYVCEKNQIIDVKIKEDIKICEMDIKNGQQEPDICDIDEGISKITEENAVTVAAKEICTAKKETKYKTIYKKTDSLPAGTKKVKTEGAKGEKEVVTELIKENGKVIEKEVLDEQTTKKAKAKVVLVGTAASSSSSSSYGSSYSSSGGSIDNHSGTLGRPLSSMRHLSSFGMRWGRMHYGIDLGGSMGTPIYASESGKVTQACYSGTYGLIVKISHGGGLETRYAHCSRVHVKVGQRVSRGQKIASMGATGNARGTHLHYEVRVNGVARNPYNYL